MYFEQALFEASAWILFARLRYLTFNARNMIASAKGEFGTKEIDPHWADLNH